MKKLVVNIAVCALFGTSFTAQAALTASADGTLIYDTELNVTWLADGNFSYTSGSHNTGSMNWYAATNWAHDLTFHNESGWRLPTSTEFNHLFYNDLGGSSGTPIANIHNNANYALFNGTIQPAYWSSTESVSDNSRAMAYYFNTNFSHEDGSPISTNKTGGNYAWAIHPGDITGVVPEPETYAMLLAGLGLLGWRLRNAKS